MCFLGNVSDFGVYSDFSKIMSMNDAAPVSCMAGAKSCFRRHPSFAFSLMISR